MEETHSLTRLLERIREGDESARSRLYALVYRELIGSARAQLAGTSRLLDPVALVSETFLKLRAREPLGFHDSKHFFACARLAMRQILADEWKAAKRLKRDAEGDKLPLTAISVGGEPASVDVIDLHESLCELERFDALGAQIVEYRFLCGLTENQVAEGLGIPLRTIQHKWASARAWLRRRLAP